MCFFLGLMAYLGWRHRPARLAPELIAWRTLIHKLDKHGIHHQAHEGPVDFLQRAAQLKPALSEALQQLRDAYVALRYEPNPSPQLLSRLRFLVNQLPSK